MTKTDEFNFLDAYFSEGFKERSIEEDYAVSFKVKLKKNWKSYAFLIAGIAAIIGFILGYIGYYVMNEGDPSLQNPSYIIYQVLKLYILQAEIPPGAPWQLEVAKYVCVASLYYFALLTIVTVLQENLRKVRLQFFKNHIIICGLNKWTSQLILDLRRKHKQVVVISKDVDNEYMTKARDERAIILNGNCSDKFMLNRANIYTAKYLVAYTEDDTKNMETAINVRKMLQIKNKRGKKLKCFIHIKHKHLYDSFSRHSIFRDSKDSNENIEMNIFNNYQNDARVLFLSFPFDAIAKKEGLKVHILVVGFGYLGESVVLQAINQGHYANNEGLKITVIDEKSKKKGKHFYYHYPNIVENIQSIEESFDITFLNMDLKNSQEVEQKIKAIDEMQDITSIVICLEEETSAIQFGIDLIPMLESERIPIKLHFPIPVYLDENEDVFKLPVGESYPISPFGLIKRTCSREMIIKEKLDQLAKAIHEDYKKKQEDAGDSVEKNPYLVNWENLPPNIKDSNRHQADHLPIKLRALDLLISEKKGKKKSTFQGFKEKEVDLLAETEHNRWCAERWLTGWRRTEGEKNNKEKLHPLLIPFEEFKKKQKVEEQKKDRDSIRNIPDLLTEILKLELKRPSE